MLDQPIFVAALDPALSRIGAARIDRSEVGIADCLVARHLLDRRAHGCTRSARRHGAERSRGFAVSLGDPELRDVIPGAWFGDRELSQEVEHLRLAPVERDAEPAARPRAALRQQDGAGDEIGVVRAPFTYFG